MIAIMGGSIVLATAATADEPVFSGPPPSMPDDYDSGSTPNSRGAGTQFFGDADIPATHHKVAPILAAHPDKDLIICIAGCGSGPAIVQVRKAATTIAATKGSMIPASSKAPEPTSGEIGDVVCVAGCVGEPGMVVHRNVRLAWLSDQGRDDLKEALRTIAARISGGRSATTDEAPSFVSRNALEPLMRLLKQEPVLASARR